MAQSENTIPTKTTGDQLTAVELNELASVQNANSQDSEARLGAAETHAANTGNPHTVTKAQVGLNNADNTSDADKPYLLRVANAVDFGAAGDGANDDTIALQSAIDHAKSEGIDVYYPIWHI